MTVTVKVKKRIPLPRVESRKLLEWLLGSEQDDRLLLLKCVFVLHGKCESGVTIPRLFYCTLWTIAEFPIVIIGLCD